MANVKISELPSTASVLGSDIVPVVSSNATKTVTRDSLVSSNLPTFVYDGYNANAGTVSTTSSTTLTIAPQEGQTFAPAYYQVPDGWTVSSTVGGPNGTLIVPDGFYLVNFWVWVSGAESADHTIECDLYYDDAGSWTGCFTTIPRINFPYASGSWSGHLSSGGPSDPAYIYFQAANSNSESVTYYPKITVTRLGD